MFSRHGIVAFGKDDTLITPHGILSLISKERVDRPSNIYDPHSTCLITDTWFSGHGERVARISNNALEVLDLHGVLLSMHEFAGSSNIHLQHFSDTGTKVVVFLEGQKPGLYCFVIDEAKQISFAATLLPMVSATFGFHDR